MITNVAAMHPTPPPEFKPTRAARWLAVHSVEIQKGCQARCSLLLGVHPTEQ